MHDDSGDDCYDLFLNPDDENDTNIPEGIGFVFLSRLEHGRMVKIPRKFSVADMHSVEQLHALYGGGEYRIELRARGGGSAMGTLKVIKAYRVAGQPKSIEAVEMRAAEPAPVPQPMQSPMVHPQEHRDLAMIALTMIGKSQENMAQMFTSMATAARADARAQVDSIRAESRASIEMMGKYFEGISSIKKQEMTNPTPTEKVLETFMEGMALGKDIGGNEKKDGGPLEVFAEVIANKITQPNGVASPSPLNEIGT